MSDRSRGRGAGGTTATATASRTVLRARPGTGAAATQAITAPAHQPPCPQPGALAQNALDRADRTPTGWDDPKGC
jgi:hypothetical protein